MTLGYGTFFRRRVRFSIAQAFALKDIVDISGSTVVIHINMAKPCSSKNGSVLAGERLILASSATLGSRHGDAVSYKRYESSNRCMLSSGSLLKKGYPKDPLMSNSRLCVRACRICRCAYVCASMKAYVSVP